MTNVPTHPAEYSPEVIDVLAELIRPGERVHDPYGGRGLVSAHCAIASARSSPPPTSRSGQESIRVSS